MLRLRFGHGVVEHIVEHLVAVQARLDRDQQVVGVERLDQIIVDAQLLAALNVAFFAARRQEDERDFDPRRDFADFAQQLNAVHLRHHDVRDDQIGRDGAFAEHRQRLLAVLDADDAVMVEFQHGLNAFQQIEIVLDDQNSRLEYLVVLFVTLFRQHRKLRKTFVSR